MNYFRKGRHRASKYSIRVADITQQLHDEKMASSALKYVGRLFGVDTFMFSGWPR